MVCALASGADEAWIGRSPVRGDWPMASGRAFAMEVLAASAAKAGLSFIVGGDGYREVGIGN